MTQTSQPPSSPAPRSSRESVTDPIAAKVVGWKPAYAKFIKSCYALHPEAFTYYEELVDYIDPGSDSRCFSLQAPELFEMTQRSPPGSYPGGFPFAEAEWNEEQQRARVAILEGFPSPDCIAFLGMKWRIRPEFFVNNLEPTCRLPQNSTQNLKLYEQPTLHSRQENMVHIRFVNIIQKINKGADERTFSQKRKALESACQQSQMTLFKEYRYGVTRFRKLALYSSQYYGTEQLLSLTIAVDGDKWTAVFLTDQSRSTQVTHHMPWTTCNDHGRPIGSLSSVPLNTPAAEGQKEDEAPACLDQYHPLKNIWVRDQVDDDFMRSDPFFLLGSVLATSVLSWARVLNLTAECVAECQEVQADELNATLDRLRHYVAMVHRIEETLTEKIPWIEQGGCVTWPKATGKEVLERKMKLQEHLLLDYKRLLKRCETITRDCESATGLLVSYSQLIASERSNQQASEVTRLSKLASFFVPFASVASIFGMNVRELDEKPPVYQFAILAIGVSILTLVVLNWSRFWAAVQRRSQRLQSMWTR